MPYDWRDFLPSDGEEFYSLPLFGGIGPGHMGFAHWFDEQVGLVPRREDQLSWQHHVLTQWQDLVHYMNRKVRLSVPRDIPNDI